MAKFNLYVGNSVDPLIFLKSYDTLEDVKDTIKIYLRTCEKYYGTDAEGNSDVYVFYVYDGGPITFDGDDIVLHDPVYESEPFYYFTGL